MSIQESDYRLAKYKTIPWSASSGLTVKLALYCHIRLASEVGSELKLDYPPLASPVPLYSTPNVVRREDTDEGKGRVDTGSVAASMSTSTGTIKKEDRAESSTGSSVEKSRGINKQPPRLRLQPSPQEVGRPNMWMPKSNGTKTTRGTTTQLATPGSPTNGSLAMRPKTGRGCPGQDLQIQKETFPTLVQALGCPGVKDGPLELPFNSASAYVASY
ncbi:uncharacterized protein BDV17DRAFT_288932 [Aspergillus undulatus]|uniref:uncharacterized protein n=1 Tax=Aspergillus undulatus TaxID=1810928 RepID=UPI003CCD9335